MSDKTLVYLLDAIWIHIIKYLSYIDKIQLGWTCTRFFKLVNHNPRMNYINDSLRSIFFSPFDDFLKDSLHKFTLKYYHVYHYKSDRLYLASFIHQIRKHLSSRFVYGHFCGARGKVFLIRNVRYVLKYLNGMQIQKTICSIQLITWVFGVIIVKNYSVPARTSQKIIIKKTNSVFTLKIFIPLHNLSICLV